MTTTGICVTSTFLRNKVLMKIFGPKRDRVFSGLEELQDLYSSTESIWVNQSRKLRWVVHMAQRVTADVHTGF